MNNTARLWQCLLFLVSFSVFYASLYFQFVKGLQPCPLCIMQRVCTGLLVASSLAGIFRPRVSHSRALFILQICVALAGLYFAGRQLWLQSLPPDQLPACLPGLQILIRYFPWQDVLQALMWGAADCGEITWLWLGLSMAAWSAFYFTSVLVVTVFIRYLLSRKHSFL